MKTIQFAKILAIAALFLLALPAAQAQMPDGHTRFGLKAGLSAANFSNSNFHDRKGRVGFVGGVFAKMPLGKSNMVSLRPEFLFIMKGATVNRDSFSDVSFKLNYLELPVSLDFNLFAIFNVHAGLQAGTLISKVKDGFAVKDLDAGWHLGAGIDLGNIGLHARYNSSFTKVFDILANDKTRNWNLTVAASFSFN